MTPHLRCFKEERSGTDPRGAYWSLREQRGGPALVSMASGVRQGRYSPEVHYDFEVYDKRMAERVGLHVGQCTADRSFMDAEEARGFLTRLGVGSRPHYRAQARRLLAAAA